MKRLALLPLLLLAAPAIGADLPPATDAEQVAALEKRLDALANRVAALEKTLATKAVQASAPPASAGDAPKAKVDKGYKPGWLVDVIPAGKDVAGSIGRVDVPPTGFTFAAHKSVIPGHAVVWYRGTARLRVEEAGIYTLAVGTQGSTNTCDLGIALGDTIIAKKDNVHTELESPNWVTGSAELSPGYFDIAFQWRCGPSFSGTQDEKTRLVFGIKPPSGNLRIVTGDDIMHK